MTETPGLSPEVLMTFLEESTQFFFVLDANQNIPYANKAFWDTFGAERMPQILADETLSRVGESLLEHVLPDQRKRVIYWHRWEQLDTDQRTFQCFMGEDRTEQDRLQRRAAVLNDIVRQSPGFLFWKDRNLKLMGCNENFARQVGLQDPEEIVGLSDHDLPWDIQQTVKFRKDDRDILEHGIPKRNIEEKQRQKEGSELYLLTSKAPLYERGRIIGVLGIYVDITALKKAQHALQKQKDQAEALNRLKTDFILNMQHDIRTPISGIQGLSEWLLHQEAPPHFQEPLTEMAHAAKELLDYCNELVDFSRMEYGRYPVLKKPFSLCALAEEVIRLQRPAAEVKNLLLSAECDPHLPDQVLGDAYRIKRILINLLSNAVKFTPRGYVKLCVRMQKSKRNSRQVIVQWIVKDNGIGMSLDQMDHIYEKFSRLTPSHKGLYKGQGLGLNRVKQFVEELEGDIQVQSKKNQGTEFSVYLPLCLPLSPQTLSGGTQE